MTEGAADAEGLRVRPYALTGGRTRPTTDVAIETLVRTTTRGRSEAPSRPDEQRRILEHALAPVSLAEVAALTHLVFGVARVIVGDLIDAGLLDATEGVADERPDVLLLERVLDGLKSL